MDYNLGGFIDDEVILWLNQYVGQCVNAHKSCAVGMGWYLQRVINDGHNLRELYVFEVEDSKKAALMKLTWANTQ